MATRRNLKDLVNDERLKKLRKLLPISEESQVMLTKAIAEQEEEEIFKLPQKVLNRLVIELNHLSPRMAYFVSTIDYRHFMDIHKEQVLNRVIRALLFRFRTPKDVAIITKVEKAVKYTLENYYQWVY